MQFIGFFEFHKNFFCRPGSTLQRYFTKLKANDKKQAATNKRDVEEKQPVEQTFCSFYASISK